MYGFIQVILFPSFFQKALLFLIDSLYFFWYWALFARPLFIHSGFVLNINSEDVLSPFIFLFVIFFFELDFLLRIFFLFEDFFLIFFLLFFDDLFFLFDLFFFFVLIFYFIFLQKSPRQMFSLIGHKGRPPKKYHLRWR